MNENTFTAAPDDLSRETYCILGIPIDAIEMPAVLRTIDAAAESGKPFVLSTPNLNFLVTSQTDPEFRESVLLSDLCSPDGMPIIWIARLLGIPIKRRVAGSDIFPALDGIGCCGGRRTNKLQLRGSKMRRLALSAIWQR
jgi:N-acetylglucosaminyldiphosphoundecaprenol N-acetyl-beta-D-mannosaminyltransferase